MAIGVELFYNADMDKEFYDDIEKLKRFNRTLCDAFFYRERGYDEIAKFPPEVTELSFPVYSPVPFIDASSRFLLDIGCGSGIDIISAGRAFPECVVAGIDTSLPLLAIASKSAGRNCLKADAVRVPFKERVFDGVLMNGVFNTIADRASVLSEISRVIKRSGFVFIADVYKKNRHLEMPEGGESLNITHAMTSRELFLLLHKYGFVYEKGRFEPDYTKELGVFAVKFRGQR